MSETGENPEHEVSVEDLLRTVITELRIIKEHLATGSDENFTLDDLEE